MKVEFYTHDDTGSLYKIDGGVFRWVGGGKWKPLPGFRGFADGGPDYTRVSEQKAREIMRG